MAKRLSDKFWEDVKKDYEAGMTQAELRKKYNLGAGTLGNKIKRAGWKLSQEQNTAIKEFKEASVKVSESFHNANDIQKKEMVERVTTILEDNELIQNNRKLLKAFQSLVGKGIREGMYKTPSDIKAGVSTIKDIEAVANPKTNDIKVENNIQNNQITKVEVEFVE